MLPTVKIFNRGQKFPLLWLGIAACLVFPCRAKGQIHPTDSELKQKFTVQRATLEKLVMMADEDQHIVRIASSFTWLDTDASWPRKNVGMTPARWDAYRSLFERLGIHGGMSKRIDYPSSIFFLVSGLGIVPSGSSKGLVYSRQPLLSTQESLDSVQFTRKGMYFEKIASNWYLFLENNP